MARRIGRRCKSIPINTITTEQLGLRLQQSDVIDLIDVRTPIEFREIHVPQARNVPLDRLDPVSLARNRTAPADDPIYFICKGGGRGKQACETMAKAGFENVINVEGATQACEQAGLQVVRGAKAVSLERQVRIAAGSLVLLGVVLAWLVHPVFLALPAFIGAGLVFSGVTDTCGMSLVLARMPWNRLGAVRESCSLQ